MCDAACVARCVAVLILHLKSLQQTAAHFYTLQYTSTHCNTLQNAATHRCTAQLLQHRHFGLDLTDICAWYKYSKVSSAVCCSVLQCVAVCCSVLQCAAVCCSVLRHTCVLTSEASVPGTNTQKPVLQCAAVCCSVLQCVAMCCSVLQCAAV